MSFEAVKKVLFFILKLGIAGAIVWYLLLRDPHMLGSTLRNLDVRWLAAAAACYFAHIVVCSWRWRRLALMLGVKLGRFESISLTMQGIFFSLVIPGGAIGGDVVKMAVLSKRTSDGNRIEGAFTVLMDRIIGMIALFLLVLVILPFALELLMNCSIPGVPLTDGIKKLCILGTALLCAAGIGASCVIFMHRTLHKVSIFDRLLKFADSLTKGMVSRLEQAADTYSKNKTELAVLVVISIFFVHIMTVIPMMFLLTGLGIKYSVFEVICAVTLGNVAGLIPIFPSGLGGRDLVTVTILAAGSVAAGDAKTAQLLYTALIILFNVSGGLFFIFDPGKSKQKTKETENGTESAA